MMMKTMKMKMVGYDDDFLKLFLLLTIVSAASIASADNFDLVIVHTNDVHARFEMSTSRGASCKNPATETCFGGVARRAGLVNQVRANNSNVLLLDAGDQFQGTPWFFTYKGRAASLFLNQLHYDAMCLGNHEFDNGVEGLREFFLNITIPVLCANLIMDEKVPAYIKDNVKKHIVVDVAGRKVGIIGYILDRVPTLSKTEFLRFENEEVAIKREVELLKQQGVNIIIGLGHAGLSVDISLAKNIPDVDVFVGAHSHSLLYTGTNPSGDVVAGPYPEVFPHGSKQNLVVQAGSFGRYVGVLKVSFNDAGEVVAYSGNPVLLDSHIPEDAAIKAEIDLLNIKVTDTFDKVVGSTAMVFDTAENICRVKECEMGNMYTDAMMEASLRKKEWQVDLAIINSGTFRATLDKGNVTYGDSISVFPFNNDIVILTINGSILLQAFEHSAKDFSVLDRSGKFLQISGAKVTYNFRKTNGERVQSLQVKDKTTGKFQEVDPKTTYKVILPSYQAGGGDGYKMFEDLSDSVFNIDIIDVDIFLDYLKANSPISACIEGRISGMETFMGWRELFPTPVDECPTNGACGLSKSLPLRLALPLMAAPYL